MKSSDAALRSALYDANVVAGADLLAVHLAVGTQYWTTAAEPIVFGGNTYSPGPVVEHGTIRSPFGTEVATCDVTLEGWLTIAGVNAMARALAGEFDDVQVEYRRQYTPGLGQAATALVDVFSGQVADVIPSTSRVELRLKTWFAKAEAEERPLRVVGPFCPWVLYGPDCDPGQTLAAAHTASDTVASGSTRNSVKLTTGTNNAQPGGTITFTSGALSGVTEVVRSYDIPTKTITLATPVASAPVAGVGVSVAAGCDRTRLRCQTGFANLLHHGGFPDLPRKADS